MKNRYLIVDTVSGATLIAAKSDDSRERWVNQYCTKERGKLTYGNREVVRKTKYA